MDPFHVTADRIKELMLGTVKLTEQENDHLSMWRCPECTNAMLEIVMKSLDCPEVTSRDHE